MGSRLEANSSAVRKRIASHTFDNEQGEEYESSKFGGFNDYFRRKKIKLQNLDAELRSQSANNPPIFRGVVAHVNGYTQPSLNDLHQLIVSHGGGFMQYLDGKTTVTHIIASNLTPKKAVEFRQYRIVKPAWVVDSIKAGKLLPWDGYRVVDAGAGQKVLGFEGGKVVSQANVQQRGYRDQTDGSWYTSQLRAEGTAPSSSHRSPFLSQPQRPPTPVEEDIDDFALDDLDDFPTSHQPTTPAGVQEDVLEDVELRDAVMPTNYVPPEQTATPPESGSAEPPSSDPHGMKRASDDQAGSPSKRIRMTAEEHNAILLADPKIRKSTVVNPDFLEQYYRESRLHHLSTWKADLKSQLQALAAEKSSSQKAKQKRLPGTRRYILHVDFDSFFAAVSLKKHPQYVDKPAVVAHGGGTGSEIASCNYPARKFGIKNGMWMKRAQELCPELKVLPYDFPAYEEASRSFYDAIMATGGIVQSVSIDEALVDVSTICIEAGGSDGKRMSEGSIYREQSEADKIAQGLRDEVKERTGCAVSVGIGPNILCAKVALRKAKPAGQYQLKPETVLEFIGALQVQDLPGVAYSIGGKLEEIGIKYVRDIREFSRERLINTLGPKTGEKIWEYSRGIDKSEVGDQVIRKSVSAEVNWGVRFVNQEQVDEFIENLCGELQKRLLKERVKGRQLTMKIMRRAADAPLDPPKHLGHGKCDTYNKSLVLGVATNDKGILTKETLSTLKGFGFSPGELRGIGVQMTKLEPLKAGGDGQVESSQRRLQFKVGEPKKAPIKETEDPIQDDIVTPKKQKADPDHFKFGPAQLNSDSPSRRPLNTLGTQFILPSQVDPQVLAELPADIRAKLSKHIKLASTPAKDDRSDDLYSASPRLRQNVIPGTILPAESQLDPETLAALPSDVRAEVLAFYQQSPGPQPRPHSQTVLPQSPRKNRTLPPPKRPAPTFPRKRGRPPKSSYLTAASGSSHPTLTQANFITTRLGRTSNSPATTDTEADDTAGEVSTEFLAALPEDIRREVIDEQRRARLKKRGGLDFIRKTGTRAKPADASTDAEAAPEVVPGQQRTLQLPPRRPRPTFTTMKLWQPDELRSALREWFNEFRDEGPYREDVEALEKYLERVVEEERDMAKAVGMAKWLAWLVEEGYDGGSSVGTGMLERVKEKWGKTVQSVQDAVQSSVQARGLGKVGF
ncbi:DNA repair protein [Saccharata proteae CBS 121410]|uniref:DNA repair protein REV1 n=1 Tax=Saccharata proteae CBS 121410 TaxID=1314787 RepID=A0A9P4LU19_9PEZI|nr:DNA repair protein [Saccharata proteae CBS 121410]